jgi:hypothetical protein
VGKWHLSTETSPSGAEHPWLQGFDQFSGSLNNIVGADRSMVNWDRVGFDHQTVRETRFSTDAIVDDALEAAGRLQQPFLLYVAFHAAHQPMMVPPGVDLPDPTLNTLYAANVSYADQQLGRLLDGLGDRLQNTLVLVLGDNGTPDHAKDPDGQVGAKGGFLEGGVNVPFIVAGPPVTARGASSSLVHVVDVFPTLMELAGAPGLDRELDGHSLVPLFTDPTRSVRELVYTELRHPPHRAAVEEGRARRVRRHPQARRHFRRGRALVRVAPGRRRTRGPRARGPRRRAPRAAPGAGATPGRGHQARRTVRSVPFGSVTSTRSPLLSTTYKRRAIRAHRHVQQLRRAVRPVRVGRERAERRAVQQEPPDPVAPVVGDHHPRQLGRGAHRRARREPERLVGGREGPITAARPHDRDPVAVALHHPHVLPGRREVVRLGVRARDRAEPPHVVAVGRDLHQLAVRRVRQDVVPAGAHHQPVDARARLQRPTVQHRGPGLAVPLRAT